MGRYKFFISASYAKPNHYLEIDEYEKNLFQVDGKTVKLLSLEKGKKISESRGVKIECGIFTNINECVKVAKKVYINFLIRLNNTDISYILDKASMGNFTKYCKDDDAEIYREIVIRDIENKDERLYGVLEGVGCGCTHFHFDKLMEIGLDQKLKDSLMINNYRKYLLSSNINFPIDNTLFSASIEMLLESKEVRNKEEISIINEVCDYMDEKFKETQDKAYKTIKAMIEGNKHKSIGEKIKDLVTRYCKEEQKETLSKIKKISENRTKEIHVSSKKKPDSVFERAILNRIQIEYSKDLYKQDN